MDFSLMLIKHVLHHWNSNSKIKSILVLMMVGLQSMNLVAQSNADILKITMKGDMIHLGKKVSETEDEIFVTLYGTEDTISILKDLIKSEIAIRKLQSRKMYELLNDGREHVKLKNGIVFNGYTISEENDFILFNVDHLSDTILIDKNHISSHVNSQDFFLYSNGKYHKKEGFVGSIRMFMPLDIENGLCQLELVFYQLVTPKQAFGAGLGIMFGSFDYDRVGFNEYFLYSKTYLNDNSKRLFFDVKAGAALSRQSDRVLQYDNYNTYSSGPQLQYGVGVDFASRRDSKWSFYVGHIMQFVETGFHQRRRNGVIENVENKIINLPTLGVSINFHGKRSGQYSEKNKFKN